MVRVLTIALCVATSSFETYAAVEFVNSTGSDTMEVELNVETEIDKSDIYNYDLLTFKLVPDSVTLMYDPEKMAFKDQEFVLEIETNIPSTESTITTSGYKLTLVENISSCYKGVLGEDASKLASGYDKIAKVHLDNLTGGEKDKTGLFALDVPKVIPNFNNIDKTKNARHDVILTFSPIPTTTGSDDDIRYCQGAFSINFGLNL